MPVSGLSAPGTWPSPEGVGKLEALIPAGGGGVNSPFLEIRQFVPHIALGRMAGEPMPTLKRFGAYKIEMFFEDHLPPHVHVTGSDFEALVRIADAKVFQGNIPHQHRKEALSWIAANRAFLEEKWNEFC